MKRPPELVANQVEFLFKDLIMLGISGLELGVQAKLIRPNLRVIYMTGYAEQVAGEGIRYGRCFRSLSEPTNSSQRLRKLWRPKPARPPRIVAPGK